MDFKLWKNILDAALKVDPRPLKFEDSQLTIGNLLSTRLLHFDRVVLGASTEDQVPANQVFFEDELLDGLNKRDSVTSHQAYDFLRLTCKEKVFLTYSGNMPSRFVSRLRAFAVEKSLPKYSWSVGDVKPPQRQDFPMPPAQFPKELSVHDVDLLLRNPYAFYAKKILKIKPSVRNQYVQSGQIMHKVLERFVSEMWGSNSTVGEMRQILMDLAKGEFEEMEDGRIHLVDFMPFLDKFVDWQEERGRRARETFTEVNLEFPFNKFTLKGRADRIDLMDDGSVSIVDYKRSTPPRGSSYQLHLYALLVELGKDWCGSGTYNLEYLSYKNCGSSRDEINRDDVMRMKEMLEELEITRQFNAKEKVGGDYAFMFGNDEQISP